MIRRTPSISNPGRRRSARAGVRRAAFTIVELMVVVAVVGVLITILLVAFRGARSSAQQALATRLLATVGQAVESFEREVGYLPPLLVYDAPPNGRVLLGNQPPVSDTNPSLVVPEAKWPDASDAGQLRAELEQTRFGSEFTLAAYLLGTGDIDNSELPGLTVGRNDANDDGQAGPGFRDPGPDRSWGGGRDRSVQRAETTATKIGRVYGPYLDPAGLADHLRLDQRTGLFKLMDSWNQPIRYYKGWPTKDRPASGEPMPSADFAPVELRTADAVEEQANDTALQRGNIELDRPLFTAKFMILSAGVPLFEGSDGRPIPLFGDRNRAGAPSMSLLDDLPSIHQNMALPFRPGTLPTLSTGGGARDLLLEDLKSNLRYVP
ncbi:MAG: prepilin-type N-terminal cleavage/methylation domain-containing protein [Phycisphaerae bacterium]|nr:prepilin-type N-terminal cleavage/methylation domain-containing protein [Phycisphaerae bacterium]